MDFTFVHICSMILSSPEYFATPPSGIISLVPSQTELLFHLGLDNEVSGITKFCVHPPHWLKNKQRVGGTKNPNLSLIRSLHPSLIIANYEENRKTDIEELACDFPVWVTDVINLDTSLKMISDFGKLLHRKREAELVTEKILQKKWENDQALQNKKEISAAYLIWKNPYMTVGCDSFIHAMLKEARFSNVFATETRYPKIDMEDIRIQEAEIILLSTEPYPFSEKDVEAMKESFSKKQVILADGEMFSWFGSRLMKALPYFTSLRNTIDL